MDSVVEMAIAGLLTPAILFFALGLLAGALRSDLHVPEAAGKFLALYLMLAIGFKGGVEAARTGFSADLATAAGAGILLSLAIPLLAFAILRAASTLDRATAAATAAHYGSVSIVTFVVGTEFLRAMGVPFGGYMVAVVALMETPAILVALFLARRRGDARDQRHGIAREVFLNGSVVLLLGAFAIGAITGERGMQRLDLFVNPLFQGVLTLFLLDMGLVAARRLQQSKALTWRLATFGIAMPLISFAIALATTSLLGVSAGDAAVLAILAASASYIAAPAAMRVALPEADAGVYLTLSLGVTFPFNVMVGIPLYYAAAQFMAS